MAVTYLKKHTSLKLYVTTAVPKTCYDNVDEFIHLISLLDGINLSVQHWDESVADKIRCTTSKFNRQHFYELLPYKEKIRINLNIVKPYLYKKQDLINCLMHYDSMGFNEIKLSEIQHGKDHFVSFESIFGIKLSSPYYHGCQLYIDTSKILPKMKTPLLLKRSCFLCEETLKASVLDGVKVLSKMFTKNTNNYGVIYENGLLINKWI